MLVSHIDGTAVIPPRLNADGTQNPAYDEWFSVDRLLVGFLRGAITPEVGAHLMHCRTAKDLWDAARNLTCAAMKSRVMVIKQELHKMKKQGMKMDDYLGKMKSLSDQLQLAGAPVTEGDLIMLTLGGLDGEYTPVTVVLNRVPNLSWIEFESRLEQIHQATSPVANVAQKDSPDAARGSSERSNWRGSRGRRGGFNNFGGSNTGGNRPYCHLCERFGHTVVNCFHRFDRSFQPPSLQNSHSNTTNHFNHFPPQALYATPQVVGDASWYFDSGASHHVASSSTHLDNYIPGTSSPYTCTGARTPVTGIGTATLHTPHSKLLLKDILVVPAATKNLLSVQKLTHDNPVTLISLTLFVL